MAFGSTVVIFVGVQIKISGFENQLFKFNFAWIIQAIAQ